MAYIQKKPCKHYGCDKNPKMGAGGYCYEHEEEDSGYARKQAKISARKQEYKIKAFITPSNKPTQFDFKLKDNEALKRLKKLNEFFNECAIEIAKNPYCDNCGTRISPADYRNAVGHILPKRTFRSIETHPLCWVKVGVRCNCHNNTHRLDKFSQMKIFPVAVNQIEQIRHLIKENHKLLNDFLDYANNA